MGAVRLPNILVLTIDDSLSAQNTCDDDCRQVYCDSGLNGLAWADYNSYGFLLGMLGVFYMFLALAISCDEFFVRGSTPCNTMWYPSTCAAIGFADVRAGTQMIVPPPPL